MFVYFAPHHRGYQPPEALAYAFDNAPSAREVVGDGPGNQRGMLFSADEHACRYSAEDQRWKKMPGTELWCGLDTGKEPPTPDELRRQHALRGHSVMLGDGQSWLVPVARLCTREAGEIRWAIGLPRKFEVGEDGGWCYGPVVARYQRLWDIATQWWDEVVRGTIDGGSMEISLTIQQCLDMAAEVLRANYRVGVVELSLLGAFESGSYSAVLDALCDVPTLVTIAEEERAAVLQTEKKSASAA